MFKFQKSVFAKLYRYYCRKLVGTLWLMLAYGLLVGLVFIFLFQGKPDSQWLGKVDTGDWTKVLRHFWQISLFQLAVMWMIVPNMIMKLTGLAISWTKVFALPTKTKTDDINTLIFTPSTSRETMILAKLAAVATYFLTINFCLLTVPMFLFLAIKTSFSVMTLISFLLINGLFFALTNFFLFVPALFFCYENYSKLVIAIFVGLVVILQLGYFLTKDLISAAILPFLFVPFSLLLGSFFFYLYWRDFCRKDLA